MRSIAVIGAGIAGITTAYALLQKGYAVTVFERHRYPAMETSFANGGQLSASNAAVWNSWSTVLHGLQWMLRSGAPLLINPKPSWHKYSWLAEFVSNIPNYRSNTIATTRLAIAARAHLYEIAERENIQFDLERRGILHIYHDKPSYDAACKVSSLLAEGGLEQLPLSAADIFKVEPTLNGKHYGGFFTPSDATGDIHKFTRGLADVSRRHGVIFVLDANVLEIASTNGKVDISWAHATGVELTTQLEKQTFDGVVISAGIASRRLAAALGDRVNIYPIKGYSITVVLKDAESRSAAPWVSLLDESAKIVTSRLGVDRFRVAGTAEFNGHNRDIRADRIRPLVEWTRTHFPRIDTDTVIPWAGLRPMMPNMMPRIGAGNRPGIFYNTGHGHLGWTLSAATAQIVAEDIARKIPV